MIVLDASVLISYLGAPDAHTSSAFEILDTEEELLLHPVTLAEALVGPAGRGQVDESLQDILRLGIERHEPPVDEPVLVADLRAETRLKLPDVYVLATAMGLDAVLATFDRRLADIARGRGLAVVGAGTGFVVPLR